MTKVAQLFVRILIAASLYGVGAAWATDPNSNWQFIRNGSESPDDQRYTYHWDVLRAALDATRPSYGDYVLATAPSYMNESRQIVEMKKGDGAINTMVLDSTAELETDLIAVKFPIDKGLLGYRVFLIRLEDQPKFSAVRTLDDLRKFMMGQARDWSDVAIYKNAGFDVVVGSRYETLFDMLMHKRFDAFGRGVTEVIDELGTYQKKYPSMAIENSLLLYYPMPVYFWFPKTAQGKLYAKRVDEGMHQIVKNGTFDRMFKVHFGPLINDLQLKKRRLFRIPNIDLPADQPFQDKTLWFDPIR